MTAGHPAPGPEERESVEQPIEISPRAGGPVTARSPQQWKGSHTLSAELLQVIGFVPVTDRRTTVMVLPTHLPHADQRRKAATAAATLRAIGHPVRLARQLEDPQAEPELSLPLLGRALRERFAHLGGDAHSDEVARTLLELSAPANGILTVVADALHAAEWWWSGAEHPVDHMPATQRLTQLADQLRDIAQEVSRLRADLALMDRHRDITSEWPPHRNPAIAATAQAALHTAARRPARHR
ncbi:hypothetical protein [Streptacidiphilus fuscans]|uniref:Uncharacterized protein n=1 Tax=Streptacidiphilus fuscans TaxID=2789292 RepID=A0A931B7D5_9ACTN|nr:hypothetical protein [Streptacidiphilus fuscans]MBF9071784.1 hypothetical protein [Streptacidiphilus fuscans]